MAERERLETVDDLIDQVLVDADLDEWLYGDREPLCGSECSWDPVTGSGRHSGPCAG